MSTTPSVDLYFTEPVRLAGQSIRLDTSGVQFVKTADSTTIATSALILDEPSSEVYPYLGSSTVRVTARAALESATDYQLEIAAGAVVDAALLDYAGGTVSLARSFPGGRD